MNPAPWVIERVTGETTVRVELGGPPGQSIQTPWPMFSHLLEQLTFHAGLDTILAARDNAPAPDEHHLVEDTGLALGTALARLLGDRAGRRRYGQRWLPMDDALALAALDIGGRPWFALRARFPRPELGGLAVENLDHFFRSLCDAAGFTLHLRVRGQNTHHMAEALFKATGMALSEALQPWTGGVRSTKGVLG